jgi:hypothetical protein
MSNYTFTVALACASSLAAQVAVTVPPAFDATDAPSMLWVPGMTDTLRQQTIIDAVHLQPMVGRPLTAVLWRRNASDQAFLGGAADLVVRIAESTNVDSLSAAESFAANLGPNPVQVFAGTAVAPSSPSTPGPSVAWSPDRTIRIQFQTPFVYHGGSLVVDVTGTARPGQSTAFWPADAAWDYASGTATSTGTACGTHVNSLGAWASAAATSLLPGASGQLTARGTNGGLAILVLGAVAFAPGLPLQALVPEARSGCEVFVPVPFDMVFTTFTNPLRPADASGSAVVTLPIPRQPWVLGAAFGTQWMDLADRYAVSNAVNCTISSTMPSLGMAHIHGPAQGTDGQVYTNHAHVMRWEAQ